MSASMPQSLFISHVTADNEAADRLHDLLVVEGFTTWIDHKEAIPLGEDWDRTIRKAIPACDAVVLMMSPESLKSDICQAECLLARELSKPLYVLRLSEVPPESVWTYIKMIQYADLARDFEGGAGRLIRTLKGDRGDDSLQAVSATLTGIGQLRESLPYLSVTPLRGREEDLQALEATQGAHVMQITGTGGLGKSRLAVEYALKFPGGAVWHRCTPRSRGGDVLELARQHYRLPDTAQPAEILARLAGQPPLVVFDNCEDIAARSEQRRDYVSLMTQLNAHQVAIVLTSRVVWDEIKPRHEISPRALTAGQATQIALDFATG